jgi:outer membrane immunogenic protein
MKKFALAVSLVALSAVTASAADMAPAPVYAKAAPPPPVMTWTGWYVGLNAGGAWGQADPTTAVAYSSTGYFAASSATAVNALGNQRISPDGFTGGGQIGYNWQFSNAVVGFESDFDYFRQSGSASTTALYPGFAPSTFTVNSAFSTDWLFTFRGRAGFLAAPNLLLYGTGGLAVTEISSNFGFSDTYPNVAPFVGATESASARDTRVGYTVGVGGEYAISNAWSFKAEYLYLDFGRMNMTSNNLTSSVFGPYPASVFSNSVNLKSNVARVGINYHFNSPVVARY